MMKSSESPESPVPSALICPAAATIDTVELCQNWGNRRIGGQWRWSCSKQFVVIIIATCPELASYISRHTMGRLQPMILAFLVAMVVSAPSWGSTCYGGDDNKQLPLAQLEQEEKCEVEESNFEHANSLKSLTAAFVALDCNGCGAQHLSLEQVIPDHTHRHFPDSCRAPPSPFFK
jgi:hypothetical protein